ncbi:hypothetical protein L6270_01125 [Candidatus Parcubacteria bacterium]|nr:hypothetical protein [Patescibacteria group bacterium]MBU4309747.1 hypothetical protein [Patescibacteria group bacterium]MBU4432195.1 hypothetical protein [Patescibacteria group bacterium]MBU4578086.1 hypothetical protein [Patescibacteria group bacterium]MCG2696624.1 hypothetical protein [Candidatus Parcubacteria bacterium]
MFNKSNKKQADEVIDDDDVVINLRESSLNEFTQVNLPGDAKAEETKEVADIIEEEAESEEGSEEYFSPENEANEAEIEESLNEIYQDDDGKMVDVKKFKVLKKHGFFFWFFMFVFLVGGFGGGGYYAYNKFIVNQGLNATAVDFTIETKNEVTVGEEFFYTINYGNPSNTINLKNVVVSVTYPDNFIFIDSFPPSNENNSRWDIGDVKAGVNGKIKIKGIMIGEEGKSGILAAKMDYMPENFSSEFKKETSAMTQIKDIGMNIDLDYSSNVLVDEVNDLTIRFSARDNNFINNFRISQEVNENVEIVKPKTAPAGDDLAKYSVIRPGVWQVDEVTANEKIIPIKFKFIKKGTEEQVIVLNFEKLVGDSKYVKFYSKELKLSVIKSDLNLTMIINGKRDDQGINFGDTLNYSLVYKNGGDAEMKDVVLMAVLDGDFLNWTTLGDAAKGKVKGNMIIWTKNEIPELASIAPDKDGTIDFSINLMDLNVEKMTADKSYAITSYAQFAVGDQSNNTDAKKNENKSNVIINKINSNLKLNEQVRYFSADNVPVGSGPNPPKAGQVTSYKVYWNLSNSLHELGDVKVTTKLPDYVTFANKANFSVGSLDYNETTREVTWTISRLPALAMESNAEFSISIKPTDDDKNRIMILLTGSTITANDNETKSSLSQTTRAETSKLEDDDIAGGDGIVE